MLLHDYIRKNNDTKYKLQKQNPKFLYIKIYISYIHILVLDVYTHGYCLSSSSSDIDPVLVPGFDAIL
jgi:hypothetical protein